MKRANKVKLDRDGWPVYLVIPSEEDFAHGQWVKADFDPPCSPRVFAVLPQDIVEHCNTQCCLVGWSGAAFGGAWMPPYPEDDFRVTPAQREFLLEFLRRLGAGPRSRRFRAWCLHEVYSFKEFGRLDGSDLLLYASFVFEGYEIGGRIVSSQLTPRRAHRVWCETAEHFGYDVRNAEEF